MTVTAVEAGKIALEGATRGIKTASGLLREPENDYEEGVKDGLSMAVEIIQKMIERTTIGS